MYATRRCTHGVPMVYPYPLYPWLTEPEGRRVRVLMGTGTGQPGITRGLPVLIPSGHRWGLASGDNNTGADQNVIECKFFFKGFGHLASILIITSSSCALAPGTSSANEVARRSHSDRLRNAVDR